MDQVDGREQPDPHNIDEMPVVRDDDRADLLLVREAPGRVGASEQEDERDESAGDVQSVEPGGQEEDRAVVTGLQRDAVLDQGEVLVTLAADEVKAHQEREHVPFAQPPAAMLKTEPVRLIWPRSTANTPSWQVTLDSSSTVVFTAASDRFRFACGQGWFRPLSTERIVKYMANSAAKNISSEDSQTMVPTLTRFGRLAGVRGTTSVVAVATMAIITTPRRRTSRDPPG